VDVGLRKIVPVKHASETKHTWVSFYNLEAETVLKQYLAHQKPSRSGRLFPISSREAHRLWRSARKETGLQITPKVLRMWFCEEMAKRGGADRYIDAFCGRTPKSVLARHYSDYSPEKLKAIYEKAKLKVLE
jgi:intergrase/recombinase